MKKIISLIVSLVLTLGFVIPVNGQVDNLLKAQSYWLNNLELSGLDAILTVSALGLDINENGFVIGYDFTAPVDSYGKELAYEDMDGGYLAKNIMALVAMKVDPAQLTLANGSTVNLIEILKSKIDSDGNVYFGSGNPESSTAYTMYALSIVDPAYDLSKLGANLANLQLADGCWGYNGAWGGPDVTGWVVGALSLCGDTYQSTINKALDYFSTIQQADGSYVPDDSWSSPNSNTQGCVVWGLLEYDDDGIKSGVYKDAYKSLMSFLLDDGSFAYKADQDYGDPYATVQAGLALGVYENGSLFTNLRNQYKKMLDPQPEIIEPVPAPEIVTPPTDKVAVSVNTGDNVLIMAWVSMVVFSGGLYLYFKKTS